MRLTTKGRYAVTAMADLATCSGAAPTPLAEIAARQSISVHYLEQLFGRLRKSGLVDSVRGVGGGYRLARPAGEIAIADIVAAADEGIRTTACTPGGGACRADGKRCLTHNLWFALEQRIQAFLEEVTLADIAEGRLTPEGVAADAEMALP